MITDQEAMKIFKWTIIGVAAYLLIGSAINAVMGGGPL